MAYTIDTSTHDAASAAARRIIDRAHRQGLTTDGITMPVDGGNSIEQRLAALEDILTLFVTAEPDDDDATGDGEMNNTGQIGSEVKEDGTVGPVQSYDEGEAIAEMQAANVAKYRKNEVVTAGSQSTAAPGTGREAEGRAYMPNSAGTISGNKSKTAQTLNRGQTFGTDRGSLALGNRNREIAKRTSDAINRINAKNRAFFQRRKA